MNPETVGLPELLVALLGGGGLLGTITGIYQVVKAHREGARAHEREVMAATERWRRQSDAARQEAEHERDWWRDRAAEVWQACLEHGGKPAPLGRPPSLPHEPPVPS